MQRVTRISALGVALCSAVAPIVAIGAGDGSELGSADSRFQHIHDRGAVLYYQAVIKQHRGATGEALQLLRQCLSLHEGFDPSGGPPFAALLKDSPGFAALILDVHRNFPAVGRAQLAFVTEEQDLVPEGLAYDPRQEVLYLGSLNRRKIVKLDANGIVSDFVPDGRDDLMPVLGIRVDPVDGSVWANSWSEEKSRSELLHFDASGRLLGRYAMEDSARHGFNDLVVRKDGAVLLTDSLSNQVYRFDRLSKAFAVVALHRPLTEPNGIALSDDDAQLFVADDFGVQRLDLESGASLEVNPGPRNTLAGVDGLYWHRGSLIGIQNGIGSPRIAAWRLSKDASTVTHTAVLEYRSALLTGEPTTGAIKGDDFYFIINSQGENMEGDHVADPSRLERVRIGVVRLP
jgi:DNA-binding beta-propeller fold protein YncE